jgi:hypothetical protein
MKILEYKRYTFVYKKWSKKWVIYGPKITFGPGSGMPAETTGKDGLLSKLANTEGIHQVMMLIGLE